MANTIDAINVMNPANNTSVMILIINLRVVVVNCFFTQYLSIGIKVNQVLFQELTFLEIAIDRFSA